MIRCPIISSEGESSQSVIAKGKMCEQNCHGVGGASGFGCVTTIVNGLHWQVMMNFIYAPHQTLDGRARVGRHIDHLFLLIYGTVVVVATSSNCNNCIQRVTKTTETHTLIPHSKKEYNTIFYYF
jgi:hypothetical protein